MPTYDSLTIGEIKKLTPEQIESYCFEVGKRYVDEHPYLVEQLGRTMINYQIKKLKEIEGDLMGTH